MANNPYLAAIKKGKPGASSNPYIEALRASQGALFPEGANPVGARIKKRLARQETETITDRLKRQGKYGKTDLRDEPRPTGSTLPNFIPPDPALSRAPQRNAPPTPLRTMNPIEGAVEIGSQVSDLARRYIPEPIRNAAGWVQEKSLDFHPFLGPSRMASRTFEGAGITTPNNPKFWADRLGIDTEGKTQGQIANEIAQKSHDFMSRGLTATNRDVQHLPGFGAARELTAGLAQTALDIPLDMSVLLHSRSAEDSTGALLNLALNLNILDPAILLKPGGTKVLQGMSARRALQEATGLPAADVAKLADKAVDFAEANPAFKEAIAEQVGKAVDEPVAIGSKEAKSLGSMTQEELEAAVERARQYEKGGAGDPKTIFGARYKEWKALDDAGNYDEIVKEFGQDAFDRAYGSTPGGYSFDELRAFDARVNPIYRAETPEELGLWLRNYLPDANKNPELLVAASKKIEREGWDPNVVIDSAEKAHGMISGNPEETARIYQRIREGVEGPQQSPKTLPDSGIEPEPSIGAERFAESKVVNDRGELITVYHGSPDVRDIQSFASKPEQMVRGMGDAAYNDPDRAFWFSSDQRSAQTYADPHRAFDYQGAEPGVIEAHLNMKNPLIIDAQGKNWRGTKEIVSKAKAEGYDGVIVKNVRDDYNNTGKTKLTTTYTVFDPDQIEILNARHSPDIGKPITEAQAAPPVRTRADAVSDLEAAKARLASRAKKLGGKRAGAATKVTGEDLQDLVDIGRFAVESGVRGFAEWVDEVMKQFKAAYGPKFKISGKQLRDIYNQSHQESTDVVSRLVREVTAADKLNPVAAARIHEARVRQAGAISGIQSQAEGQVGFYKQLGQLKGQIKPAMESIAEKFTQEEIDELFRIIQTTDVIRPFEKVGAQSGMEMLLAGYIPPQNVVDKLYAVFGKDFIDAVAAKKQNWVDVVIGVRRSSMLSGVRTALRNIMGNTSSILGDEAANIPATLFDWLLAKTVTGKRARTLDPAGIMRGSGKAATKGVTDFVDAVKGKVSPEDLAKYDIPYWELQVGPKPVRWYVNMVGRLLGAYDKPARAYAFARSISEQARTAAINEGLKGAERTARIRQLIANPTEDMAFQAIADAEQAIFANSNQIAEFINKAKGKNQLARITLDAAVPFVTVPTNIAGRVIEMSPLGLAYNLGDLALLIKHSGLDHAAQRSITLKLGRGLTGSAAMLAGYYLYKRGDIPISPLYDPATKDVNTAAGQSEAAVRIGNSWYRLGDTPIGILLAAGATMAATDDQQRQREANLLAEGAEPDVAAGQMDMLKSGMTAFGRQLSDMPMVQGASTIAGLSDPSRSMGMMRSVPGQYISSFVPKMASDIGNFVDPTVRSSRGVLDPFLTAQPIPAGRELVPAKTDLLGRPVSNAARELKNFWNPFFGSQVRTEDPAAQELSRLKATIKQPSRKAKLGEDRDEKAYQERLRTYGDALRVELNELIATPWYQSLDDQGKLTALKDATRRIRTALGRG